MNATNSMIYELTEIKFENLSVKACQGREFVKDRSQCCHIWRFIANLATFDTNLLLKFHFGYLAFLATFLATFESLI